MKLGSFLKLVEIQTKVASVIPYLLGTVYVIYKFDNFNIKNAVLLFVAMLVFDMTTTAINNYIDYKKAVKKEGYGYEIHNAIVKDNLNSNTVMMIIIIMLIISSLLGIILVIQTDIVVLLMGILCFIIGILYSFGPVPISRTPFGEIFSGLTMGFMITFLGVYIHIFNKNIIQIDISEMLLSLGLNGNIIMSIFILTIPTICGISNIMLANNICDMEDDFENRRYTLPIFIGKKRALFLFKWIYYIGFVSIVVGVIFSVLPITSLIVLIAIKPVNDNIKRFNNLQSKNETFVLAVKNFVLINIIYILTIVIGTFAF